MPLVMTSDLEKGIKTRRTSSRSEARSQFHGAMFGSELQSQIRRLNQRLSAAAKPFQRLQQALERVTPRWTKQLDRIVKETQRLARILEELPGRQREAVLKMAEYGWYMDSEMGIQDSVRLAAALEGPDEQAADEELCSYFECRLSSLELELREKFPHRTPALNAAFRAHERGDYYCSTPVLLGQAEGICGDLVGHSPYLRKDGHPVLRQLVDSFDSVRAAFAAPLGIATPLVSNKRERETSNPKLNRHAIMHGESVDYGTRDVSARAISFLAYVSWTLDTEDEETSPAKTQSFLARNEASS